MRRPHHDEDRTPREVETEGDAGRFAVDPDSGREAVPIAREAAAPRAGVQDRFTLAEHQSKVG